MKNEQAITTLNWGTAPNNRWSFQHMQSLFPTCRIRRGTLEPHRYEADGEDLQEITFSRTSGETSTVRQMIDDSFTDSFLVVRNGVIVTEEYHNNMTADSHHLLNSVTKSFVGMLAGIAVERNLLNPEAPVTDYLPDLNNSAWQGTTVRQLLDMTAGACYSEDYAEPETDFWKESAVVGWRPALVDESTPDTLFDYARSMEGKDQENGAMFHYKTVTTNVMGMILERVMDGRLGDLLSDEIWSKLKPRNDAAVIVDKVGGLYVGAGMNACTRDLANFGQVMINDGIFNGEQIVPAGWIQDTTAGDSTSSKCFKDSEYAGFGFSHYRNQVWVKDAARQVMLALGIHGQIIYMNKADDVVIVKLSTQPESVDAEMFMDAFSAMDAIAEHLSG